MIYWGSSARKDGRAIPILCCTPVAANKGICDIQLAESVVTGTPRRIGKAPPSLHADESLSIPYELTMQVWVESFKEILRTSRESLRRFQLLAVLDSYNFWRFWGAIVVIGRRGRDVAVTRGFVCFNLLGMSNQEQLRIYSNTGALDVGYRNLVDSYSRGAPLYKW